MGSLNYFSHNTLLVISLQNFNNMGDNDDDKSEPRKDEYFGIIAINEAGAAYVQMYKQGDEISPEIFDDKKWKHDKVQKLVERINRKKVFYKSLTPPYVLVISSPHPDDYKKEDFDGLEFPPQSIKFIALPNECECPIAATLSELHITVDQKSDKDENLSSSTVKDMTKMFEGPECRENNQDGKNLGTSDEQKVQTKASIQEIPASRNLTYEPDKSSPAASNSTILAYVEEKPQGRRESVSSTNSRIDDKDVQSKKKPWYSLWKGEEKDEKEELLTVLAPYFDKMEKGFDNMNERFDNMDEKIRSLECKVTKFEANMTKLLTNPGKNDPIRSLSKRKDPPAVPSSKGVRCHIFPAPAKVKQIQSQFTSQLTGKLNKDKLHVQEDPSGPSFVFTVNSSRLISDIHRDLKSVTSSSPIFLLVIKPTMRPELTPERLDVKDLGVEHLDVEEAGFLYVDIDNRHLHDCPTNDETLMSVIQFLNSKKQGTRV